MKNTFVNGPRSFSLGWCFIKKLKGQILILQPPENSAVTDKTFTCVFLIRRSADDLLEVSSCSMFCSITVKNKYAQLLDLAFKLFWFGLIFPCKKFTTQFYHVFHHL